MLSALEEKLLALALDPGAMAAEADRAGEMFFRSLRKRGVTLAQFKEGFASLNGSGAPPAVKSTPDFGMCVMPWKKSKHYGKMFMDIPPHELMSSLRWIKEDPDRAQKMRAIAEQIEGFLRQCKS